MKLHIFLFTLLAINLSVNSQNLNRDNEMKETINWINKQFRDNSFHKKYTFKEIEFVNNEPILFVVKTPGSCSDSEELEQIPIRKIKQVRFEEYIEPDNYYNIYFETKNGEEIVWYQSEDKNCGQIGDYTFLYLNKSIENDNLIKRLKDAFYYLMKLYDNDGKEKF